MGQQESRTGTGTKHFYLHFLFELRHGKCILLLQMNENVQSESGELFLLQAASQSPSFAAFRVYFFSQMRNKMQKVPEKFSGRILLPCLFSKTGRRIRIWFHWPMQQCLAKILSCLSPSGGTSDQIRITVILSLLPYFACLLHGNVMLIHTY